MRPHNEFRIRPLEQRDRTEWGRLYELYLRFYETSLDADQLTTVWGWLNGGDELHGLVADSGDGLVGLAHYRVFLRPSAAQAAAYLDDLFVDPAARRRGVADTLLTAVEDSAAERGLNLVRWITAADNLTARAVYDRRAKATSWVTYDMQLGQ